MSTIPQEILIGLLRAALASVILVAWLWLLARGYPRLYHKLEHLRTTGSAKLRIQGLELLSADRLAALALRIARLTRLVLTVVAFYLYTPLVLSYFPWTAPFAEPVVAWAIAPFATVWVSFVQYLPSIFWLAAIVIITRWALQLLGLFAGALRDGSIAFEGFYPEWAEPTYKIVRVLVLAFALVMAFPYLPGSNSDAFKGVSIFLGVLFSLGSSSAVANVVAGIVLTYTRSFKVGDFIRIASNVGTVEERTLLVTRLRTPKGVEVTIPNAAVLSGDVQNFSANAQSGGVILHTAVTIGYDAPWRQVHALLLEAARQTPDVEAHPAPFVLQNDLGDFSVRYELNGYTKAPQRTSEIHSQLHAAIQDSFARAGVEIMSPMYVAKRDGPSTVPVIPSEGVTPG